MSRPGLFLPFVLMLATVGAEAAVSSKDYHVHLAPVPADADPYVYFPFEVLPGTDVVTVELSYDRADGQNAIDYALFDARFSGRKDDLTGYRGKNPNRPPLISVVGRTTASYGHIPGPMPAGTWRVMFYVYKTEAAGVDVTLRISLTASGTPPEPAHPGWMTGDLHTHTLHSDGIWTVNTLQGTARNAGLDFIAITDHNTVSTHAEIDAAPAGGPLLIHGIELTTYGGHANVWGIPGGTILEHRQLPSNGAAMRGTVEEVHRLGGLISINHPFADCKACNWSFEQDAAGFDGIEVWNGAWGTEDQRALDWWESLLKSGRRITAVGSSDSHGPQNPLGQPTVHVAAGNRTEESMIQALRKGQAFVSASPGVLLDFTAHSGDKVYGAGEDVPRLAGTLDLTAGMVGALPAEMILYSSAGEVKRWVAGTEALHERIEVPPAVQYYRLEVRDKTGAMLAFTNPIWLKP